MKKFTMALAASAALTFVGGAVVHADDNGDYVVTSEATNTTIRDQGGPTTTGMTQNTEPTTTKLAALPTTGSDSSSPLQMGGIALLTGVGLVSVASVRRRKPTAA